MVVIAVIFALLSAALDALGAVFQRRATGQVEARHLFRAHIIRMVLRHKLWLTGVGLNVVGFFALAIALHSGSLVLVQPLLITDILFLFLFIHFGLKQRFGWREVIAASMLVAGLSVLLVVARPRGGTVRAELGPWLIAFLVVAGLIIAGAIGMRRATYVPLRAAIGGVTAGLHYTFMSAFAKLVIEQLQYGFWHEFLNWPLYGLIIVGVTSALSMQSMYGSGPLTITQPALEITEAVAGISTGVLLFGDFVNHSAGDLAIESAAGLVAAGGIVLLAGSNRLRTLAEMQNT